MVDEPTRKQNSYRFRKRLETAPKKTLDPATAERRRLKRKKKKERRKKHRQKE